MIKTVKSTKTPKAKTSKEVNEIEPLLNEVPVSTNEPKKIKIKAVKKLNK